MKNTVSSQRQQKFRLKRYKEVSSKDHIPRVIKMAKLHETPKTPEIDEKTHKQNLKHDKKKVEEFLER